MTYREQQLALVAGIPRAVKTTVSKRTLTALVASFEEFGVNVDIVKSWAGPQVETVALQTRRGERLKSLRTALPDIALRIGVPDIRINPRFSDRQVTVEISRTVPSTVSLSDVLFTDPSRRKPTLVTASLPWVVGVSSTGDRVVRDLADAPHVLISGATGSGKSAALEAMITGLAMTVRPEDVEIILVDPKRVDLAPFATLPHVRRPMITSAADAEHLCVRLRQIMAARYTEFQKAGVSNIAEFLAAGRTIEGKVLQRIVVVVDELADLVCASNGKLIEGHLIAIAQMARAAGIHLVCATQRPSSAVLSTQLRSQLPTRLVFAVASATDSRVAMDEAGAEKLMGKGDGLLKWAGGSAVRLQGVFLTEGWVPWLVQETRDKTCAGWIRPVMPPLAPTPVYQGYVETPLTNAELMKKGVLAMWWMKRLGSWGWIVPTFFM